ncbi:MAG: hypothetical protein ACOY3I_07270 [Verrucomicrobiota bacterium]
MRNNAQLLKIGFIIVFLSFAFSAFATLVPTSISPPPTSSTRTGNPLDPSQAQGTRNPLDPTQPLQPSPDNPFAFQENLVEGKVTKWLPGDGQKANLQEGTLTLPNGETFTYTAGGGYGDHGAIPQGEYTVFKRDPGDTSRLRVYNSNGTDGIWDPIANRNRAGILFHGGNAYQGHSLGCFCIKDWSRFRASIEPYLQKYGKLRFNLS